MNSSPTEKRPADEGGNRFTRTSSFRGVQLTLVVAVAYIIYSMTVMQPSLSGLPSSLYQSCGPQNTTDVPFDMINSTTLAPASVISKNRTPDEPTAILVSKIQVSVVLSPAHGEYWERFYANSNGWHRQFADTIKYFTFDRIAPDSPVRRLVEPLELFPFEHSAKHSNLLLAALQRMYELNNASDWYFLAEDDTIVHKGNLKAFASELNHSELVMKGKCVNVNHPKVDFVMGGAGTLMSQRLLREMYPHMNKCRKRFNRRFGDVRIGNCIKHFVKPAFLDDPDTSAYCSGGLEFPGNAQNILSNDEIFSVITLHEKSTERTRRFNEIILNTTSKNEAFTTDTLKKYKSYWMVDERGYQVDESGSLLNQTTTKR